MDSKQIKITDIEANRGQINGLPRNPRIIKNARFEALKKSIQDAPEMLNLRELLVFPHEDKFVVIGGNMRLKACKELGFAELPCKVLPIETPVEKLREYTIKDNVGFGEDNWDDLLQDWDSGELTDWGMELKQLSETEKLSGLEYKSMYYQPVEVPKIKLNDCVDLSVYNAKLKVIQDSKLTREQKQLMQIFAYRFIKIDFENVANYYYFNASEEERKIIERLRLVLIDGGIDGFIEDDMLRLYEIINEFEKDREND